MLFQTKTKHKKKSFRHYQHSFFWGISLIVLSFYFGSGSSGTGITTADIIYTIWFHISLAGLVYVNTALLIPRFLSREKFVLYSILFLANIMFFSALNHLLFSNLIDYVFPGYYFISYYNYFDLLLFHFIYATLSTLLKLSKAWFNLLEEKHKVTRLQMENRETELKALKAQINPHFMFNSLNNIYALALKNSKKTPEMILLLSNLMRYIIYETSSEFVPLKNELKMLEDYISLQKIRSTDNINIGFKVEGKPAKLLIAPLLLLPLVENVFKHGIKNSILKSFAKIEIRIFNDSLFVKMINSLEELNGESTGKGIGLENVKKRLELIYPDDSDLQINKNEKQYSLTLNIRNLNDAG